MRKQESKSLKYSKVRNNREIQKNEAQIHLTSIIRREDKEQRTETSSPYSCPNPSSIGEQRGQKRGDNGLRVRIRNIRTQGIWDSPSQWTIDPKEPKQQMIESIIDIHQSSSPLRSNATFTNHHRLLDRMQERER